MKLALFLCFQLFNDTRTLNILYDLKWKLEVAVVTNIVLVAVVTDVAQVDEMSEVY